ncbi:LssY C-terminal domain-containing protein [Microbacterium mitrae]|uniref:LssY C-terminal domain-containing protein n=1 Tax=Microbacterium mitrae TaxID=664640 RepID=UPI0024830CEB|nr:LssY C-terminal domain-containing protein [Microbacterium mitrae]
MTSGPRKWGQPNPTAPVSTLMLFGRRHDVAYQQEVAGNPKQRHHVRFWHTPAGWMLPGGAEVDWLGAGTYDTAVGISWFTLQVTHRIDENTDIERDFVVSSMIDADTSVVVNSLPNFTTGYHSRNGGGDRFITDGALPIVNVSDVVAAPPEPQHDEPASTRNAYRRAPLSAIAAALLTIAVSILDIIVIAVGLFTEQVDGVTAEDEALLQTARLVILGFFVVLLIIELLFVRAFLRRGRRARVVLMTLLSLSILTSALNYLYGVSALKLDWTLLSATLQCIALIAFATESTARWVRSRAEDEESGAAAVPA